METLLNIDKLIINNKDIIKDINIDFKNEEGLTYLKSISDNSVDLILTDPPYVISKSSGMNTHYNNIKNNKNTKTEEQWGKYKKTLKKPENELQDNKGKGWSKENYLKYGCIMGKKYAVQTDYGKWDNEFTIESLEQFIEQYYKKLKKGGTCIIWLLNCYIKGRKL